MLQLIVGTVLAVPSLLWTLFTAPIVIMMSLPAAVVLGTPKKQQVKGEAQVIITGGSSGIGLGIAKTCIKDDSIVKIILVARNMDKLRKVREELDSEKVEVRSLDVSDAAALEQLAQQLESETLLTHVFCCAGFSTPQKFELLEPDNYKSMIHTNQLGTIFTCNAFAKGAFPKGGTLMICSSMAGLVGVYGFTGYSPTKFALRGYAECLSMELRYTPWSVQIAYPPDTDTPGFENENTTKPHETHVVSEVAGLADPVDVGAAMFRASRKASPNFTVHLDFLGFLLSTLTSGFAPPTSVLDTAFQIAALPLLRWVAIILLNDWYGKLGAVKQKDSEETKTDKLD